MEWTSNGPRSNLESGLVPGGRSAKFPELSGIYFGLADFNHRLIVSLRIYQDKQQDTLSFGNYILNTPKNVIVRVYTYHNEGGKNNDLQKPD